MGTLADHRHQPNRPATSALWAQYELLGARWGLLLCGPACIHETGRLFPRCKKTSVRVPDAGAHQSPARFINTRAHHEALAAAYRAVLLDPDLVADFELVELVVRHELAALLDKLLNHRVLEDALHRDDD